MSSDAFDKNELRQLRELITGLTSRIERLEEQAGIDAVPPVVVEPEIIEAEIVYTNESPVTTTGVDPIVASPAESTGPAESPVAGPVVAESFSESSLVVPKASAVSRGSSGETLESLIGGRLFTWAGGVLLILATAFFVVWSWRNLDLPDWSRVAMMHAVGLGVLIAAGWCQRRKLELHSQALYGVGIFGLYAAALAMTHLYQLGGELRELYGFVDGAIITALAIFLSLRQRSVGIILLGALGGYLVPLVTIYGTGDEVVMFVYLALLNVALMVSAQLGNWSFLKPLAWTITALIFLGTLVLGRPLPLETALGMLGLHYVIFLSVNAVPQIWRSTPSNGVGNVVLVLNSLGFLAAAAILYRFESDPLAVWSLILAVIHGAITWSGFLKLELTDRFSRVNLGMACLFLTLALTFALNESREYWITVWSIEAMVFAIIGFAFSDRQMLWSSALLFAVTLVRALLIDFPPTAFEDSLWHPGCLRWMFVAGTMAVAGFSYWWVPRVIAEVASEDPSDDAAAETAKPWPLENYAGLFAGVANLVLLTGLFLQFQENLPVLLICLTLDIALLWAVSFVRNLRQLRLYASTLSVGLVLFAAAQLVQHHENLTDLWSMTSRLAFGFTAITLIASGMVHWKRGQGESQSEYENWNALLTSAGHALLVGTLSAEIRLALLPESGYADATALTCCVAVWSVYAVLLLLAGFRIGQNVMRIDGTMLFLITVLTVVLLASDYSEPAETWGNWPRFCFGLTAVLLIVAGTVTWMRRDSIENPLERHTHAVLSSAGHLFLLLVLTAEIANFYGPAEGGRTTAELATYSVVWGVYAAAMVLLGFLLRYPLLRFIGIGLFPLILFKVFFVDLGQVELIVRVVALLILGLLLLGVSLLYQKFRSRIAMDTDLIPAQKKEPLADETSDS